MDRRLQSLLGERQRLEQLQQQLVQIQARNSDIASQLRRLPFDELRQNAELRGQLGSLSQQQSRAKVEVGYTLTAPVDGRVTALQISPGRNIDARMPLMAILPDDAHFRVQLFAPSKAAGFIRIGQAVRISYDAFPYQKFGTFAGVITAVSRTAYAPSEIDVPLKLEEPVYPIEVKLADQISPASARLLPLQSGMTLNGTIILERRSFLDWILQPINAVQKRI
jgi:membrane fusion protein